MMADDIDLGHLSARLHVSGADLLMISGRLAECVSRDLQPCVFDLDAARTHATRVLAALAEYERAMAPQLVLAA